MPTHHRHRRTTIGAVFITLIATICTANTPAAAEPLTPILANTLGAAWSQVLTLPTPDNPFATGGPCIRYNGPFGLPLLTAVAPLGAAPPTCTIQFGRSVFVEGWTSECSNAEDPPFHGDNELELRTCAEAADAGLQRPVVTIDGRHLPLSEVVTPLLHVTLPPDNVLGQPAGFQALSVAHGWVALLPLLLPGRHVISIEVHGDYVNNQRIDQRVNTTIIVKRP